MALLPTGIVVGTNGVYNSSPTEEIGGVLVGITSATTVTAGNVITQTFPVSQNAIDDGRNRRSVPVEASGAAHAFSTQKAYSAGTFAYAQSDYMVRTVATTVNGVVNTTLLFGNEEHRVHRNIANSQKGALLSTAYRAGYWQALGVSGQRTNWTTSPTTGNVTYRSTTNNAVTASDEAIYKTYKSIPGELTYMYGAIDANQDDYAARTL
jgi:hypothetical protein